MYARTGFIDSNPFYTHEVDCQQISCIGMLNVLFYFCLHRVHCQLISLFARGIEDMESPTPQSCASCCNVCDPEDNYKSIGGHT